VFEGWDDTDPTRTGVYTARTADGSDVTRLTSADGPHDIPSDWSPDGTSIVYYRAAPDPNWDVGGSLRIVNSDGTENRPIDTTGTVPSWWARWSPDGTKILFASARTHDEGAIWTVDSDGSNLTQVWVDPDGGYPITPTWSPDGTMIMFALDPISDEFAHPPNEVYVINADGTNPALVLDGSDFKRRFEWWP
jgi:Tol biopolymer transport system component